MENKLEAKGWKEGNEKIGFYNVKEGKSGFQLMGMKVKTCIWRILWRYLTW